MADSKYFYPGTDILINHANLRDKQKLAEFEAEVTVARLGQLQLSPLSGRFDLRHWQLIHRHIFQDVYPFAGQIRDEQIAKGDVLYGSPRFIATAADDCFRQLKAEKHLVGLERTAFIDRTAHFMTELYSIHPFREGNSRSLREFTRTLGLQAGYHIKWPQLRPLDWFETMRHAFYGEGQQLRGLLINAILNAEPDRQLMTWFRGLGRGLSR